MILVKKWYAYVVHVACNVSHLNNICASKISLDSILINYFFIFFTELTRYDVHALFFKKKKKKKKARCDIDHMRCHLVTKKST